MPTILTAQYFYLYHPSRGFFTGFEYFPGLTAQYEPKWHDKPEMPMSLALYPSEATAEEAVDQIIGCYPPEAYPFPDPPVIYPLALPMPA